MANTLRIKRRAAGGAIGAPSTLQNAELAFNESDDTLYYGKGSGGAGGSATSVIPIAGPGAYVGLLGDQTIGGNKVFTNLILGTVAAAVKLSVARNINGTPFDGTGNITITASTPNSLSAGTYLTGSPFNGGAAATFAVDATSANTASKVVARDASGNFSAGTISAALAGNASTATTLATARNIAVSGDASGSAAFNGSADAAISLTLASTGVAAGTYKSVTVDVKGRVTAGTNPTTLAGYGITDAINNSARGVANGVATLAADGKVPASQLPSFVDDVIEAANFAALPATGEASKLYVTLDNNKVFRWSGTVYIEVSASAGNADTATKLTTARTIAASGDATWSVNFDGSANVSSTLTLANTAVTAGSFGTSTAVPVVTFDSKGRATAASAVAIAFPVTSVAGRTGAVTLSTADVSGLGTMATQNANAVAITGGSIDNISFDGGTF